MSNINTHYLYATYAQMKQRCRNSKAPDYKYYGGRGVKICDRWLMRNGEGFRNFLADMGDRPRSFTLDRIDNEGDYTPENCQWSDRSTQNSNRRLPTTYRGRLKIA